MNVLEKANDLIHGERVKKYGPASVTFFHIAKAATLITGKDLTAEDICKILVVMKLVRDSHSPDHADHILDACGYLGIIGDIRKAEFE